MKYRMAVALMGFAISASTNADAPRERALALAFNDAAVKWGPCPDFMPKSCQLAVLHGDPTQRNADVFLKVPGDTALPHHRHTSAERMILVSGVLEVQYDGQPARVLKPGMYAYGPAQHGHKAMCAKGDPCVLFIAFESPVDAIPSASVVK
jgi:quercetin dioxygenase-like cupin family protein